MGGGGRAWPTPGVPGNGLGTNAQMMAAAPALQPDYRPTQPLSMSQPLKPISASVGRSLLPGQPALPTGQSAMNPWGVNRGGSGAIPVSRRPGTMPASKIQI